MNRRIAWLLLAAQALAALAAHAGEFSVSPVRLDLGASRRTGAFTVRNEGDAALAFQVQGMAWSQDAQGEDHFEPATDLVYFPRILTLEPRQDAVVRVGLQQALVAVEKSYRLFIEELPGPQALARAGASQVTLLVRFAPPVFVAPAQPLAQLELENFGLAHGEVRFALRNAGNAHMRFESIRLAGVDARGAAVIDIALEGRYLLAGARRPYTAAIDRAACLALRRLRVEVKADPASAARELVPRADMCG